MGMGDAAASAGGPGTCRLHHLPAGPSGPSGILMTAAHLTGGGPSLRVARRG